MAKYSLNIAELASERTHYRDVDHLSLSHTYLTYNFHHHDPTDQLTSVTHDLELDHQDTYIHNPFIVPPSTTIANAKVGE